MTARPRLACMASPAWSIVSGRRRANCSHEWLPHETRAHMSGPTQDEGSIAAILGDCYITTARLVRIVEEKLVAVGILDHQQPVAPVPVLDRSAAALELDAQRVERRNRGF